MVKRVVVLIDIFIIRMTTIIEEAEKMKNLGNEEFKKNNFSEAIKYYTEAICKADPVNCNLIFSTE